MVPAVQSILLVDGNNVIYARPELLKLYQKSKASAHSELIRQLETHQDFSNNAVVVVFDGIGQQTNETREKGSIRVMYSSKNETADSIIERLAVTYADQYRMLVATNDIPVQDGVVAAGGEAMSVQALFDSIEKSNRELNRFLDSHRRR